MIDHTIHAFDADLSELAGRIEEMGRLDERQISDAIQALTTRDVALAERIIAADDAVTAEILRMLHRIIVFLPVLSI
jgi:phosphate transport system protein